MMMDNTQSILNRPVVVECREYSREEITKLPEKAWGEGNRGALLAFLKEWYSDSLHIELKTSGSTGEPKRIKVKREDMWQSAEISCRFFSLQKGMSTLISLSMSYIASKMVVIRAIVSEMNIYIIEPTGRPLNIFNKKIDFIPLVPLQLINSLKNNIDKKRIQKVSSVLIGGASTDESLENSLKKMQNKFYASYGMTETLSHIAIRSLNGKGHSMSYTPLKEYKISTSDIGTLMVELPWQKEPIITNDIIELKKDGTFIIKGRCDNVVNSGGVKIHIEEVEKKISNIIDCKFALSSIADKVLGERLILVTEEHIDKQELTQQLSSVLTKYETPQLVITHPIPLTASGKIDRCKLKEKVHLFNKH